MYEAALRLVPIEHIKDAAGMLVRDATLRTMPTPGQWLEACEDAAAAAVEHVKQLPPALDDAPVHCEICRDTGWAWYYKADGSQCSCPPMGSHSDYFVRRCACRAGNPAYLRKHVPPKVPKYTSKRKPKEKAERWFDRD